MITFGSVCSGIEAASIAWNPLGWKAAWLSEIERFPCAVLQHHYPDVPNLGDMTKIAHLIRDGFVPAPDVFCGGTPCQAFSIAGLRNSLDDARGNLSLTFCEIANEIDTRRAATGLLPSVVFWENVPGVLSTKDNAFGCFLAGLAGEDDPLVPPGGKWANAGCVFGPQRTVAWRTFDAQYFGLAQRRRRVFVVASAREGFDPTEVLFEFDGLRRDSPPSREAGQNVAGTISSRTTGGGGLGTDFELGGGLQPVVSTLDASYGRLQGASGQDANHGHSHLVPVAFGGNNQSGPIEVATASNACNSGSGSGRLDFETETFLVQPALSVALRGREGGATAELGDEVAGCLRASSGGGDKPHVLAPIAFDTTQITSATNRSNPQPGDPCHPLAASAHPPAIAFNARQDPDSWTERTGPLDTDGGTQAVCVTGDITHTLKAEGFDASEDGTGRGQPIVTHAIQAGALRTNPNSGPDGVGVQEEVAYTLEARAEVQCAQHGMAVRRLSPVECERLQGFEDNYTFIPTWNGWRPMDTSETPEGCIAQGLDVRQNKKTGKWRVKDVDGPRYKALGNSWAINNVRWIGERIDRQLRALSGAESEPIIEKATA